MSKKKRKSFSVSEENAQLCEELDNASAVVDDLLSQYRKTGERNSAALEMQLDQTKAEIKETEDKLQRLKRQKKDLEQLKAEFTKQESAELQQARQELEGVPREETNPAIQNWAGKLGMTVPELLQELDST